MKQALYFEGDDGEDVRVAVIPEHLLHETAAKRQELLEAVQR
jgi:hypothetical protein